jgi:hypothetical protein
VQRLLITSAALVALAVPASSSAVGSARWTSYPTCTANATTLTCSGRAAGVQPRFLSNWGPVEVGLFGTLHYECLDPFYETTWYGTARSPFYLATTAFQNGKQFSIKYEAPDALFGMQAAQCTSGLWARPDKNYYDVSVAIGWAFEGGGPTALSAPIGTVTPG